MKDANNNTFGQLRAGFRAMNANPYVRFIYDFVRDIERNKESMQRFSIEGSGSSDQVYATTFTRDGVPLDFKFQWTPCLPCKEIWIQINKAGQVGNPNYFGVESTSDSHRILFERLIRLGKKLDETVNERNSEFLQTEQLKLLKHLKQKLGLGL